MPRQGFRSMEEDAVTFNTIRTMLSPVPGRSTPATTSLKETTQ